IPATSSTGNLRQELESPLACAEIRLVQCHIGVNDPNQGYIREMKALRDHLRSEQHINLSNSKIAKNAPEIVFSFERIGVHSFDSRLRKKFRQRLLNFL